MKTNREEEEETTEDPFHELAATDADTDAENEEKQGGSVTGILIQMPSSGRIHEILAVKGDK